MLISLLRCSFKAYLITEDADGASRGDLKAEIVKQKLVLKNFVAFRYS